ncbi:hypothetical protein [Nocardia vaccinii]|uniref:hypothetical protein n=1 Tax=Nocardia vaccinii TaxID=1822 RepID=UPI00082FE180|nr:hypothetical protein [Nocardia vaccinii]
MINPGARLESQVCETQVIVIRVSDTLTRLRCGGAPMVPVGDAEEAGAGPDPRFANGSALGKRYTDESGAELLVTRAGAGTLTIDDTPLQVKRAKALPSSD